MNLDSIPTIAELSEELAELEDWDERYEYLVDLGRQLPPLDPALQTDDYRVHGCMSTVWLDATFSDKPERRMQLAADSDSLIVKGLIVLLMALYQDTPAAQVSSIDARGTFENLGLAQHLSPNRRNGLFAMVQRVQQLAANAVAA